MATLPAGKKTIYLLDATAAIYRAFYALPDLRSSKGEATGAIHGVASMVRRLQKERAPDRLVACFDLPGKTDRHDAYAEYKAHRPPMPDDLAAQMEPVKQVLAAFGIPVLEHEGQEADDIMGTLATKARAEGWCAVLVTSDKDMMQLIDDESVLFYHTGKDELWGKAEVEARWGVAPERIGDVLAIMGDASDNVPGVKGIGEKGATELVRTFGTLEQIYAHLEEVKPALRKKLEADRANAELSRALVTIRCDLPFAWDDVTLGLRPTDPAALTELSRRFEIRSLAADAPAPMSIRQHVRAETPRELGKRLAGATRIAIATDGTAGAIATGEENATLFPWRADLVAALANTAWTTDDGKRVLLAAATLGVELPPAQGDLSLASYVLAPGGRSHAIPDVLLERSGRRLPDGAAAIGDIAIETWSLLPELEGELLAQGLDDVYRRFELPLVPVLARMERRGIVLDCPRLAELSARISADLARLEGEIHALAGESFNVGSPQQLGRVLFEKLGLTPSKKTSKTKNFSTNVEVLEGLAAEGQVIAAKVLEWREIQKLLGTYVDALPKMVDAESALHSSFRQTVAATGRLASTDPNLQNIPVRTPLGREIRRAFVARPRQLLVSLDYSQIELRLLAHCSNDPALIAAFRSGADIHAATAAEVFGVARELVTPEQRRGAKAINFGILYGMGAFSLAKDLGVSGREAKAFIEAYFARFPTVRAYLDSTLEAARRDGAVRTLWGRIRRLPEISSRDHAVRANTERMALNAPLQGAAADVLKLAMIQVDALCQREGAAILLSVHDELLLEVPADEAERIAEAARKAMEGVAELAVPLVVDVGIGPNWLDAKH